MIFILVLHLNSKLPGSFVSWPAVWHMTNTEVFVRSGVTWGVERS